MEKQQRRAVRSATVAAALAMVAGVLAPAAPAAAAVTTHYYELTHLSSSGTKLCLTSTGKGAPVVLKTCSKSSSQQWFQLSFGNDIVLTNVASVSKTSRSYVLTSSSQNAGATFTMQPVSGGKTQLWRYGRAAKNNGFVNASSGRVMEASSLASGARVKVAASQDGGYLQAWSDYGAGTYN